MYGFSKLLLEFCRLSVAMSRGTPCVLVVAGELLRVWINPMWLFVFILSIYIYMVICICIGPCD
ncbi:hypothetical protein ACE6H2_026791 [Prunus campanulata]